MKWFKKIGWVFVGALSVLSGCSSAPEQPVERPTRASLFRVDSTIRPQDDFYAFVNGRWLKDVSIPMGSKKWSAWDELEQSSEVQLEAILNRLMEAKSYAEGSDVWKMTEYYRVAKDSLLAEQTGLSPVYRQWQQIDALKNLVELQQYLIEQDSYGLNPLFRLAVNHHPNGTKEWSIDFPELGMGDESRYYLYDERSREDRVAYEAFVTSLLSLTGAKEPQRKKEVTALLKLETLLARAQQAKDNKQTPATWLQLDELSITIPLINWNNYFTDLGIKVDSINVGNTARWKEWSRILTAVPFEEVKLLARYYCLRAGAPFLNHQASLLHHQYYHPSQPRPGRTHSAIQWTNTAFPDVLGKFFLAETMSPEKQAAVGVMVENIKFAMAGRIKDWQLSEGDSVKQLLLDRLKAMDVKLLIPEGWQSYRDVMLQGSAEPVSLYQYQKEVRRFVQRNRLESGNATASTSVPVQKPGVYVINDQQVVITPAMLQTPFYAGEMERPFNYGATGTWIAQVLLEKLSEGMVAKMVPERKTRSGSASVNSLDAIWQRLQEESITIGWEAFQRSIREEGARVSGEGFDASQQFFLAFAQSRRSKVLEEQAKATVKTNVDLLAPHPINNLLSGIEPFQQALGTAPSDRMYRELGAASDKLANY